MKFKLNKFEINFEIFKNSLDLSWGLFSIIVALGVTCVPFFATYDFSDGFTFPKWVVVYLLGSTTGLSYVFFHKNVFVPRLPSFVSALLIILLMLNIFNSVDHTPETYQHAILDRLTAFFLIFIFYIIFKKNILFFKFISFLSVLTCMCVTTIGLMMVCHIDITPWSLLPLRHNIFFGNPNMASEYLVCVLPAVFFCPLLEWRIVRCLRHMAITSSVTLLITFGSRSALLSAALVLAILLLSLSKKKVMLFLAIQALSVFTIQHTLPRVDHFLRVNMKRYGENAEQVDKKQDEAKTNFKQQKILSMNERIDLWKASISLIRKRPLGVGSGNFLFFSVPEMSKIRKTQNEISLFKSPHNEYLRILTEDGVVYFSVLVLLNLLAAYQIFLKKNLQINRNEKCFIAAWFSFLFIQMMFQFPLDNAIPFLFFLLVTGFILSKIVPPVQLDGARKHIFILFFTVLISIQMFLVYRVSYANYLLTNNPVTHRSPTEIDLEKSCNLDPGAWNACLMLANLKIKSGKIIEAQDILINELQKSPFNYPSLKALSFTFVLNGNQEKACEMSKIYDRLFMQQSTLHNFIDNKCPPESSVKAESEVWIRKLIEAYDKI